MHISPMVTFCKHTHIHGHMQVNTHTLFKSLEKTYLSTWNTPAVSEAKLSELITSKKCRIHEFPNSEPLYKQPSPPPSTVFEMCYECLWFMGHRWLSKPSLDWNWQSDQASKLNRNMNLLPFAWIEFHGRHHDICWEYLRGGLKLWEKWKMSARALKINYKN